MPSYVLKRSELYTVPYVTQAGNPLVDKGVMSGFNSSIYAATTGYFPSGTTTFEIVFKFTTGADVTTRQCLYNTSYVIYPCIVSGKFTLSLGNGSSWSIISEKSGSHSVQANTTYWHRVKFDGAASTLSYSTDGKNWTTDITVTSTVCASVGGNFLYIGVASDKTYPFFGSIDFNECYSNANGARWWTGMSSSTVLPNVTKFGTVMTNSIARLWNFSNSNYATIPMTFKPKSGDTWELGFKVKTGSDVSSRQQQFLGIVPREQGGVEGGIISSKWILWAGSASDSHNIAKGVKGSYTVLANTVYWIKIAYNGSAYTFSYSLDGKTYVTDISVSSTTAIYANTVYGLGGNIYSTGYAWSGYIYLPDCYAKINDKLIWKGTKPNVVVDNYVLKRKIAGTVLSNYTLPTMTSASTPQGSVSSNVSTGDYTNAAYNFWFGGTWHFEAEGRTGSRYNRYTFVRPLKPDTYTFSFKGNIQLRETNTGTLSVWYTDGTKEAVFSYKLTTSSTTYSGTIAAKKPIATVSLDMTVGTSSTVDDVTFFSGMSIVSKTGQLQVISSDNSSRNYIPKKRTYLKYAYEDWTQPVATANTTAIAGGAMEITSTSGDTGSTVNYAWYAMDNTLSGNRFWEVKAVPSWWQVKFPYKLKITGLTYYKGNNDDNNTTSVAFYTSSAMTTQIGNTLSSNGSAWQGFNVSGIPAEGIVTDTIYVRLLASTSNYTSLGELKIKAKKRITVEATKDDYDFWD